MSLKAFHLLFISVSIVLSVVFGMWAVSAYRADGATTSLVSAALGFTGAVGLGLYEAAFIRKCRRLGV